MEPARIGATADPVTTGRTRPRRAPRRAAGECRRGWRASLPGALPALLLATALAACSRGGGDALPGTLERDRIELAAQADDPIVRIAVREGEHVAAGAVLLAQDPQVAASQLAGARAQQAEAEARLDEARHGPLATTIAAGAARADRARSEHDAAERERRRLQDLVARRLVSAADYDRQAALVDATAAAEREAQAALRELRRGTREEARRQAERAVEQAAATVRGLELTSARLEVHAPRAAIVDSLPWQLGERPPRGATVAVLLADGAPYARIQVPAAMRTRLRIGTPATVRVDGVASPLQGRVRYVSTEAAFTPYYSLTESDRSRLSYLAEVELEGAAAAALPAGLPLEVDLAPPAGSQ